MKEQLTRNKRTHCRSRRPNVTADIAGRSRGLRHNARPAGYHDFVVCGWSRGVCEGGVSSGFSIA
jgi:hypothetical protein